MEKRPASKREYLVVNGDIGDLEKEGRIADNVLK